MWLSTETEDKDTQGNRWEDLLGPRYKSRWLHYLDSVFSPYLTGVRGGRNQEVFRSWTVVNQWPIEPEQLLLRPPNHTHAWVFLWNISLGSSYHNLNWTFLLFLLSIGFLASIVIKFSFLRVLVGVHEDLFGILNTSTVNCYWLVMYFSLRLSVGPQEDMFSAMLTLITTLADNVSALPTPLCIFFNSLQQRLNEKEIHCTHDCIGLQVSIWDCS